MVNVKTLTDEELTALIFQANQEQAQRRDREKREDWRKVVDAIRNYTTIHQHIEVHGLGTILEITSMSAFEDGVITVEY